MNMLGRLSSLLNNRYCPPVLQPAVREIRLERTSVRGVARVAGQTLIPVHSLVTLRITGVQRPSRPLLASPLAQPLPRALLLIPTLVSEWRCDTEAGVCASLTRRLRTTSLPDTRQWQCYMQWTALKATRVCRLRRPATR